MCVLWACRKCWISFPHFDCFPLKTLFLQHHLCIEETFRAIDTLKNQTVRGEAVDKLFQNLHRIKKIIDQQKVSCRHSAAATLVWPWWNSFQWDWLSVLSTEEVWRRETEGEAIPRPPAGVSWRDKHGMDDRKLRLHWLSVAKAFGGVQGHFVVTRASQGWGLTFQCN